MAKMTTEEFIARAKQVHGDKYDYSLVKYVNAHTKIKIICQVHGVFEQTPDGHLKHGCSQCSGNAKMNTALFIEKAKRVHGNKYDYSKVVYENTSTKVCIICPEHGEFWQKPNGHLNGAGCSKCSKNSKITFEDFIKKAKEIHGDKYDYSKVNYVNVTTKVCIICQEHGEFWQTPSQHLSGYGCKKCGYKQVWEKRGRTTTEDFIKRAREVHGNKFDYSKTVYKDTKTEVCIICPEHGEFWQKANNHLNGNGCPLCNHGLTKQYKFNLLEEFESEYAFRAFLENHDINILLSILMNIEPKYEPLKKDIERALAHANEVNPIQSLREKYSSDAEESDDDDYIDDTDTTDTDDFDWDNDDEVNDMISQESETETDTDTDDELTIDDIIRNDEEEIRVINRLDSEHLITPEVREYIKAKYKNDMMRAWMAKRDNK